MVYGWMEVSTHPLSIHQPNTTTINNRLTRTEAEGAWGPQITRLRALCARAVRRARASAAAAAAAASAAGVCGDDEVR